ncbi:SLBB domain-containing protein [Verrucomicrobiaceae bacterium 227]
MNQHFLILLFGMLLTFSSQLFAEPDSNLRDSHVLRPNDVVKLSVYEEPELESEITILKSGQATFPLIGTLQLSGLSLGEASREILKRYATDYIRNPKLSLTVSKYATEFVSVIGQVGTPGEVPIPQTGNLDVASALLTAGDITDDADPNNIQLVTVAGETRTLTHAAIQGEAGRLVMKSGDKLIVHESPYARSIVSVIGEVNKPGAFPLPKSGKMDLVTALAQAGGPTEVADTAAIKVISSLGRVASYALRDIQSGQAGRTALQGGDRVVVSRSPFANTTVTILGQVKNPGAIAMPIHGRLDIMTAIAMAGGYTDLANQKKVVLTRNGVPTTYDLSKAGAGGRSALLLKPNDIVKVEERWW